MSNFAPKPPLPSRARVLAVAATLGILAGGAAIAERSFDDHDDASRVAVPTLTAPSFSLTTTLDTGVDVPPKKPSNPTHPPTRTGSPYHPDVAVPPKKPVPENPNVPGKLFPQSK